MSVSFGSSCTQENATPNSSWKGGWGEAEGISQVRQSFQAPRCHICCHSACPSPGSCRAPIPMANGQLVLRSSIV